MAGRALSESEGSLSSLQILSLGLRLSRLLHELAKRGEPHVAVDPEHILWDREGGHLWLFEWLPAASNSNLVSRVQHLLNLRIGPKGSVQTGFARTAFSEYALGPMARRGGSASSAVSSGPTLLRRASGGIPFSACVPPRQRHERWEILRFCERASRAVSAIQISTGLDLPGMLTSTPAGHQRLRKGPTTAQRIESVVGFLDSAEAGFGRTSYLFFKSLARLVSGGTNSGFSAAREALRQWERESCEAFPHRLLLLQAERARRVRDRRRQTSLRPCGRRRCGGQLYHRRSSDAGQNRSIS